ncbi:hypothetical protein CEXT_297451 [Caerostris extrusa]|uniref:Uncharacterized protein n=1 Tax=Caerostris extrusa TaxID=172846 RepID=A0AAV4MHI3_CAEEX|nr:hypothetical protein CEXT_297451 [Caerostris extrusa]
MALNTPGLLECATVTVIKDRQSGGFRLFQQSVNMSMFSVVPCLTCYVSKGLLISGAKKWETAFALQEESLKSRDFNRAGMFHSHFCTLTTPLSCHSVRKDVSAHQDRLESQLYVTRTALKRSALVLI